MTESQPDAPRSPQGKSRPLRPVLIVLCVFIAVMSVVSWNNRERTELVRWRSDLPVAKGRASIEHKQILLYFTASWCAPCQAMRRRVWTDPRVADALSAYIPVRIDVDQQPQLAKDFHIETLPMFFIMDEQGNILRSKDVGMEVEEFLEWLSRGEGRATRAEASRSLDPPNPARS